MANVRAYGMKSAYIPNRVADMRRRNKAFWKGREFAENDFQRGRDKQERRIQKERAKNV